MKIVDGVIGQGHNQHTHAVGSEEAGAEAGFAAGSGAEVPDVAAQVLQKFQTFWPEAVAANLGFRSERIG